LLTYAKVFVTAWCQHKDAIELGKPMRKAFGQAEPPGYLEKVKEMPKGGFLTVLDGLSWLGSKTGLIKGSGHHSLPRHAELGSKFRRHTWTHTHSLYAMMGGFVIDTSGLDKHYLLSGKRRMTLTLEGLKFIAEQNPDLIPNISTAEIQDKSKGNTFAKLITCGQALWFGTQCLTRLAQGLSISLLEFDTVIHAVCVLALYSSFWWEKPLDVDEPTTCTHNDIHSQAAFMVYLQTFPSMRLSVADIQDGGSLDLSSDPEELVAHPIANHILLRPSRDRHIGKEYFLVYHGFAIPRDKGESGEKLYKDFTEQDFERLELASKALGEYWLRTKHLNSTLRVRALEPRKQRTMGLPSVCSSRPLLSLRSRNRPSRMQVPEKRYRVRAVASGLRMSTFAFTLEFALAGLFYGSVHLLVWNRPFRSGIDELLWKLSILTILGSGVPFVVGGINKICCETLDWLTSVGSDDAVLSTSFQVMADLFIVFQAGYFIFFMIIYIMCRGFIIVECFLDVFHLPDSAFEVPRWSHYFPHIG
jgi:hypothetical protein